MIRVGIVGSENSHTLHFGKLMNVDKKIRGARAVILWGEEPKKTQEVAVAAQIPEIVDDPKEMIGQVDAVIVDHRHAKFHVPAARPLVLKGIPTLVDKPFAWTVDEGKKLLSLAKRKNVLVTSYSCVRYSDGFLEDKKRIKELGDLSSVDYYGPCDVNSIYGGIFFYGVHQVEMMVAQLGPNVREVQFHKGMGAHHTATIIYKDGGPIVTLHLIKDYRGGFRYTHCGSKDTLHQKLDSTGLYEKGLKAFLRMLKSGKNDHSRKDLLAPVAVLEGLARSIKTGKRERLPSF